MIKLRSSIWIKMCHEQTLRVSPRAIKAKIPTGPFIRSKHCCTQNQCSCTLNLCLEGESGQDFVGVKTIRDKTMAKEGQTYDSSTPFPSAPEDDRLRERRKFKRPSAPYLPWTNGGGLHLRIESCFLGTDDLVACTVQHQVIEQAYQQHQ